jgi:4-amino-4-deoxy-L-arabinose transferase-like glycosyltransferase
LELLFLSDTELFIVKSNTPDSQSIKPTPRKFLSGATNWFQKHWRLIFLFTLCLGIRLLYYHDIQGGPCYNFHEWDQTDMHFFDFQARQISAGDWLLKKPLHPLHDWHLKAAQAYFSEHPEAFASYLDKISEKSPEQALWDDWYGGTRFHQEPLYPYLLAAIYSILGADVRYMLILQLALGTLSVLLLYSITGQLFGQTAGLIAGLLAAFCGPALFYEMVLLRASLISFWGLLLVWCTLRVQRRQSPTSYLALGLAGGLALLIKSNFLILLGGISLLILWEQRNALRQFKYPFIAMAAGFLIAMVPLVTRNLIVDAPPLSRESVTAVGIIVGNNRNADPWMNQFLPEDISEVFSLSNGAVLPTLFESLRVFTPSEYARLIARKVSALLHSYEAPNNVSYDQFKYYYPTLSILPVNATIVYSLALAGLLIVFFKRDNRTLILGILIITHLIPLLLVVVSSRYRLPLILALIPFSALAADFLIQLVKSGKYWRTGIIVILVFALGVAFSRPLPDYRQRIPVQYWVALYQTYYQPRIANSISLKDFEAVLDYTEELFNIHKQYLEDGVNGSSNNVQLDHQTATHFNRIRGIYALTLKELGRLEEGNAIYDKYVETQTMLNSRNTSEKL